jgi:hypothetical protein
VAIVTDAVSESEQQSPNNFVAMLAAPALQIDRTDGE